MLKTYIKIAWRNLMKNKFFSAINIFGLSVGLACCMLIALYIHYETNYDSHQKHKNELYLVATQIVKKGDNDKLFASSPVPLAAALKQEFPEIKESVRILGLFAEEKTLLQYTPAKGDKKSFLEEKGFLADPSFFNMFTYNFIEGAGDKALDNPFTIVLSENIAKKFFGNEKAINKVVHVTSNTNGEHDYTVTGVYRPNSTPSHIAANFFMTFKGGNREKDMAEHLTDFATTNMFYTYIQLNAGASSSALQAKLPAFIHKYADASLSKVGFYKKEVLVPIKDLHFDSEMTNNISAPVNKTYLYILASIAVFTLLIACINFMNLSTARSSKRSTEVGIRKVLGAEKSLLIKQFLGESMLMAFMSFLLAIILSVILLPLFSILSGKQITLSFSRDWSLLLSFLVMAVFTGLLAGSYPAFYLSSFNPVKVLKGKLANSLAVVALRKGLVVFQFVVSIVLIIATVIIARQLNYLRNAELGFNKEQQLIIPLRSATSKALYTTFKNELKHNGQVLSVGASGYYPGIFNSSDQSFYREGQTVSDAKNTKRTWVDENYLQTLGLKLVAGRLFSKEFRDDSTDNFIINESAVKAYGFTSPQSAIGKKMFANWQGQVNSLHIIGVVKDFHFEDLHVAVTPYAFNMPDNDNEYNYMVVHTTAGNVGAIIKSVENIWHQYNSNEPFEYSFLDAQFQKNYAADTRLAGIVGYFTAIAILISCLGLFGLAAFSAEQRTKEIGVRKVLGASVATIISLLSAEFFKLIIIAIFIASPIAWWVMNKWLQGFAYREQISWVIFVYTALITLGIGLLTISYQAIRAAIANPITSLRTE